LEQLGGACAPISATNRDARAVSTRPRRALRIGRRRGLEISNGSVTDARHRVNSFMQSLLQKVSFYLCLYPMNNEDKMIPSAAVTA